MKRIINFIFTVKLPAKETTVNKITYTTEPMNPHNAVEFSQWMRDKVKSHHYANMAAMANACERIT